MSYFGKHFPSVMDKIMSRAFYNHPKKHNQKIPKTEFYSAGKKLLDGDFVSTM